MTTVCIVVHAEGPGETGNPDRLVPPGESLLPEETGPAHTLVRRILSEQANIPAAAIDFREPYRTQTGDRVDRTGTRAEGSMLLKTDVLDDILAAWILNPPLIIFLVDSDESKPNEREKILEQALVRNYLKGAVGVAVKEFEAWLIADTSALSTVFGDDKQTTSKPEGLPGGEAKKRLQAWCAERSHRRAADIRKELVDLMDFDVVSSRCPSFQRFREELLLFAR